MILRVLLAVLMHGAAAASAHAGSLEGCEKNVDADERFAPLIASLDPGARTSPGAEVPFPTDRDRQLLRSWIAARGQCLQSAEREGNAAYRPPLDQYAIDAGRKLLAEARGLADGKISRAEFARQRTAIEAERQNRIAGLNQRIRNQNLTFEADQRARQLERTQRDLEDAERQANLAQQEVAEMEARRALYAQRYRSPAPPPVQPVNPPLRRNCWTAADGRVVCARR